MEALIDIAAFIFIVLTSLWLAHITSSDNKADTFICSAIVLTILWCCIT